MISIDDHAPSDPSSSHQQQNSYDLKVCDTDLKPADAADHDDTNNQLPNFSIRDYVFGLRSKDIACNWPFSSTSLRLCLKHGVKNLLPPFQSLDCLRNKSNNSSLTRCSPENRSSDEQLISSFVRKPINGQFKPNKKLVSTNPISSKREKESKFHLQGHSGQTKSKEKPPASSQKPGNASVNIITKKSRLVVKVNSGVEHVAPNSETMVSKVCPVCKIFSSSSNTTLNAHIDQCLNGEVTMKWTDSPKVVVKHKVKPRKMRLMLDIYKTAPHCTIEELDRRNGTSWATNSSFPAQEFQFQEQEDEEEKEEEEKEEPRLTKVNHVHAADNEGDVYIDTNGTKVRILSVPKIGLPNNNNLAGRKIKKGVKGSKLIMCKKNNIFKKKHQKKYLKLTPNARKLCSTKPKVADVPEKSGWGEDDVMGENCSKDLRGKEIMKTVDLGISRPSWACSKRTGLSKKFNFENREVELKCHKKKDLVVETSGKKISSLQSRKKMITSSSLVKPPLNRMAEFRKETRSMHHDESDDDDDDESDDDDDDDDDYEGTPYVDNRSKGVKFSSLSRNQSFPASRFNLKRKFSAVETSRVKSVDFPSQDSSKEQSRMDEHTSNNKKQETRSITSKTSNEESSVGIQAVSRNELESIGNGSSLPIRAPSFMGLSSFDPEFSNQECIDLYQDQICSTNRAPDDVEKQENYLQQIDPIPIPGPPGSFLPASPGGEMVSEEQIQETRVHSSENQHHHDTMDRDSMSNSPVSTVSNSRSSCGKDDMYTKPYFNSDTGFTETGQSHNSFKNDPPCCSRKEAALSYQDSYILRKQHQLTDQSTNFKKPVIESAASPSKPILRLMGKNLTVVKTDDDEFRPPQSSQRPVMFTQYQNGFESQHLFNVHPSRSHTEFGPKPVHRGFTAPVDYYGKGGPYQEPVRPHYVYNAGPSSRPVKDIVILDDSPEKEDDNNIMQNRFLNRPHTAYPPYVVGGGSGGGRGGSMMFHGGSFQPSDNGNVGGKWNIGSSTSYHNIPPSYP
ncbi:uncharacterized protein LOC143590141 isoform X1 [Bidens hawaiensis]|uniref:uncharacterized protein LOC143590141 isoform X1 n=1 Tax=Bidens hawaiensis TaxID=980011 RepID=UPI00404B9B47